MIIYNKTTTPIALAAGNQIVILPASPSVGVRAQGANVTTAHIEALSSSAYDLIKAQVVDGNINYEWIDNIFGITSAQHAVAFCQRTAKRGGRLFSRAMAERLASMLPEETISAVASTVTWSMTVYGYSVL